MERRIYRKMICTLFVTAAIHLGMNLAQAGPGGGTYYANSPAGGTSGAALRKFVDSLPGVGAANKNNLGSYIPIATPITGKPGVPPDGDYYEIGLVEYHQKMHSDLPKKTRLRGYRDLSPAFTNMSTQYLGPLIIAKRDRPVRLKFTNMLPTGAAGNLPIPVDTTLMGSGMGPLTAAGAPCDPTAVGATCASYTQNRATLHLHGGNSPWISDGTPHQWTAPAGEATPYKKGTGARDVPDMPASGDGNLTFFWTNQQSNRLMFYHDHSLGITRLNVYAGEAAGFLLTDSVEEGLINNGTLPNICPGGPTATCEYRYGIPLIIQDKTFVPQNIAVQDTKWTNPSWGGYGDLWMPHVYEANQDPTSPAGANPFGRWDYGPWFWPPIGIAADKSTLPEPSTTPEAFNDTPLVNGTAYPYLTVEPKPYRFRILNASNDRAFNLSLFYSDPTDPSGKEVKMVTAAPNTTPGWPAGPFPDVAVWPTDGRNGGVPDPATIGPKIIQIGNESGFLPNTVIHPNQPVNYNYNRRDIVVLNVQEKNLFMGSAERADIIIDFSLVPPGSNIILYNDAPAPVPAGDPRQDYYTGNPDQASSGGSPSTLRGYGPNTRTIMQFRVAGTPSAPFNLANLQSALPAAFSASQPAPVVPQPTYPVASGGNALTEQYAKIQDYNMTFTPIGSTIPTTIPFQPKAIQELWDPYGRMNATLGVELPFTTGRNQTTVPMGYAEPPTERIVDGHVQMWKITHNGVDTHPVHFHMFDVQVINRVGWDGAIRPPDDNELGWKETVRMNPLEDIIVALRPKAQTLPAAFGTLPNSKRAIDPTMPNDAMIATTDVTTNPAAGVATTVRNTPLADPAGYDYGYEYVWHCHILGHEENDFMRPVIFAVSTAQAPQPTGLAAYPGGSTVPGLAVYVAPYTNTFINKIVLQWTDNAPVTTPSYFLIERSSGAGFQPLTTISYLQGYPPIYTDASVAPGVTYSYRVTAQNAFANSLPSNVATVTTSSWTAATGVTLTPSKPSPHVAGTNVQFTALGSGATATPPLIAAYQYRFLLNGVEVQAYSNNAVWTLSDTTPVGSYTVTVQVRTSSAVAFDRQTTLTYLVVATPTPPVTLPDKVPGIYAAAPVVVTLTSDVPTATIYYTTDGTIPTTATVTNFVGSGVINIIATTTVNYFAVDVNGNAEAMQTGTWIIHPPVGASYPTGDLSAAIAINGGALISNSANVTLNISAFDPAGVASMMFANGDATGACPTNPASWSVEYPYATTISWSIDTASPPSVKTVCVKFRDKSLPYAWTPPAQPAGGILYPPVKATIIYDNVLPVSAATPPAGTYASGPISVTLTSNKIGTLYYTNDGSTPTFPVSGTTQVYTIPIPVTAIPGQSTTIKYFSVDTAGNQEAAINTGIWSISSNSFAATVKINGGAPSTKSRSVLLDLATSNPNGVAAVQFSTDGVTFGGEVPINTINFPGALLTYGNGTIPTIPTTVTITNYPYALAPAGTSEGGTDGTRTVYVKLRDGSNCPGGTCPPAAYSDTYNASITLDTSPPVTTASPSAGNYAAPMVTVNLTCSDGTGTGCDRIYFTTDGSTPAVPPTGSTQIYTAPIILTATATTLKYLSVDLAGNQEPVRSGDWNIPVADLVANISINNGSRVTNSTSITLTLNATDPNGISKMQFSNDGVNYTIEENYAVTKAWTLTGGDEMKTVYVRFRDATLGGGNLHNPVSTNIILDTTPPVTTAGPVQGIYSVAPNVVLTSNETSTIYYTTDGSTPTTGSSVYVAPIAVTPTLGAVSTIKYFAVDTAGNVELVKSGTWTMHTGDLVVNTFKINGGALSTNSTSTVLTIDAVDPGTGGVSKMAFSNDGISYSAEEPYTTSKVWAVTAGDGAKVVYARFRDNSLPTGFLYAPVTTTILLDTTPPVTTAGPVAGTYSSLAPNPPVYVTLTCNDVNGAGCSRIYYTTATNGSTPSDPTTGSTLYSNPILVGTSTTIKYRAIDNAGNLEAIKSGFWDIHSEDLVAGVKINNGNSWTGSPSVILNLSAQDSTGITKMQFSNDGITYTPEETFPGDGITATTATKTWTLTPGEGVKTVYVRFRDGSGNGGNLYAPLTSTIIFGAKDGFLPGSTSYLSSSLKALRFSSGIATPTPVDLVHGDIAPYVKGVPNPDGKIDELDVYTIMKIQVGLIPPLP
jgi:FtsP/CotA-like multicopper oxidase with cupredoxin domain